VASDHDVIPNAKTTVAVKNGVWAAEKVATYLNTTPIWGDKNAFGEPCTFTTFKFATQVVTIRRHLNAKSSAEIIWTFESYVMAKPDENPPG
jgi:hypothetical protein